MNYTQFLKELRAAIENQPSKYVVSFTAPTSYWYLRHFDIKNMMEYVDFANIMSELPCNFEFCLNLLTSLQATSTSSLLRRSLVPIIDFPTDHCLDSLHGAWDSTVSIPSIYLFELFVLNFPPFRTR